ncbi:unnamed protein product [Choristocarpus tenellus]
MILQKTKFNSLCRSQTFFSFIEGNQHLFPMFSAVGRFAIPNHDTTQHSLKHIIDFEMLVDTMRGVWEEPMKTESGYRAMQAHIVAIVGDVVVDGCSTKIIITTIHYCANSSIKVILSPFRIKCFLSFTRPVLAQERLT